MLPMKGVWVQSLLRGDHACCLVKKERKKEIVHSGRRKWQPTPVFLPGKVHGRRSLVGCSPWVYMTEHACLRKVEGDGWVGSDKLLELKKREREMW